MDGLLASARVFIEAFLAFEYADETLIVLGGLLVLYSTLRILRSSLVLVVWVAIAALGIGSISYGMNRSAFDLPSLTGRGGDWFDRVGEGAGLSADALARLCRQFIDR